MTKKSQNHQDLPMPLRQLGTLPPRMQVGSQYTHEQRSAVLTAFNTATLAMIRAFAQTQKMAKAVDFTDARIQTNLPIISFRCTDAFARALEDKKLPGVGTFMTGSLQLIKPVR